MDHEPRYSHTKGKVTVSCKCGKLVKRVADQDAATKVYWKHVGSSK